MVCGAAGTVHRTNPLPDGRANGDPRHSPMRGNYGADARLRALLPGYHMNSASWSPSGWTASYPCGDRCADRPQLRTGGAKNRIPCRYAFSCFDFSMASLADTRWANTPTSPPLGEGVGPPRKSMLPTISMRCKRISHAGSGSPGPRRTRERLRLQDRPSTPRLTPCGRNEPLWEPCRRFRADGGRAWWSLRAAATSTT